MNFGSHFEDRRPFFAVFVAGRADLIPGGAWMHTAILERLTDRADARPLVKYLDDVLWKKRQTHRVTIYTRSELTAVNCVIRAYAKLRLGGYQIVTAAADTFGPTAAFRRDLTALASCNALVWYGPREHPAETGHADPVTIAAALGIEYRVVPFPAEEPDPELIDDLPAKGGIKGWGQDGIA